MKKSAKTSKSTRTKRKPSPKGLNFLKYLPALVITVFATLVWSQPQFVLVGKSKDVLAYATDISIGGLQSATNAQRSAHGVGALSLNSKLNSAAQAKANDMVARNYWSHQTPDGQQPWVFITNAGYQYLSAGENLAYGFSTSSATVTGWMNSPSHKANMLSGTFTEVGFGIANSANYVGSGPQTVVVAMYGKPQTAAPAPTPTPPSSTPVPQPTKPATKPAAETKPEPAAQPAVEKTPDNSNEQTEKEDKEPIATAVAEQNNSTPTAGSTKVQRVQLLTGGSAIWSATFVILAVCSTGLLWMLHHGYKLRRLIKAGENFIAKHLYIDLAVLAVIYLGFVLLSTSGVIR